MKEITNNVTVQDNLYGYELNYHNGGNEHGD